MSTPILNPNSSSTINTNTNFTSSPSQTHIELGKILRQHDPDAIRLHDFMNHVKVFLYNSNTFRWENNSCIEGSLFAYEKQQIINNNQRYPSFAFAVINREQHLIQEITLDISEHANKLILFYEITRNDKREVFSLHFLNENECQRLNAFINRSIQLIRSAKEQQQQSRGTVTGELQLTQTNKQKVSANIYRQQTPINIRNSATPQFGSSRQTPIHLTAQQSTPVINGNSNTEDPTSSLKRLLNIPNPNSLDNEIVFPQQQQQQQQNLINLIPPSAFETILSSSMSAERDKHNLSHNHSINREHFRNVLLHLVQNNDHFLDIIHQACITHQSK